MWLRDLAASLPPHKYTYIGTDINPQRYPRSPPSGMSFKDQNINEAWPEDWKNSFDFVHQRLTLVGAGPATKDAVTRLLALVKPGGWVQLIEAEQIVGKNDGPAMHQFLNVMVEVFKMTGSGTSFAKNLSTWVRDAGFETVQDRLVDMYLGASNPTPQLARLGTASTKIAVAGLVEYAKGIDLLRNTWQLRRLTCISSSYFTRYISSWSSGYFGGTFGGRVGKARRVLSSSRCVGP